LWLHSLKVAQLLRSAACLHTNQSRSYLNHLVLSNLSDCQLIKNDNVPHSLLFRYIFVLHDHDLWDREARRTDRRMTCHGHPQS